MCGTRAFGRIVRILPEMLEKASKECHAPWRCVAGQNERKVNVLAKIVGFEESCGD